MKFAILALAGATMLAGCADRQLTDYICTHQISTVAGANFALANADKIKDETLRNASIATANIQLALVKACPNSIIPADAVTVSISPEMLATDPIAAPPQLR